MLARLLLVTITTAMMLGGAAVLHRAAPPESIAVAASSVPTPVAEGRGDSVSVLTEVVTAQMLTSPRVAAATSRATVRSRPAPPPKRSLLARVLLGSGETRPEPFPRPGRTP
jgi:hypothetical protein